MIRRVHEEQHHSAEEVTGYLDEALRIVSELEVEGELRLVAFGKAVDLLAAKQIFHEQVQPTMAIPGQRLHG